MGSKKVEPEIQDRCCFCHRDFYHRDYRRASLDLAEQPLSQLQQAELSATGYV